MNQVGVWSMETHSSVPKSAFAARTLRFSCLKSASVTRSSHRLRSRSSCSGVRIFVVRCCCAVVLLFVVLVLLVVVVSIIIMAMVVVVVCCCCDQSSVAAVAFIAFF